MSGMRAVRRNFSGLERRRMEAARLLREGVWQAEVARRMGVRRQSVGEWAKKIWWGSIRACTFSNICTKSWEKNIVPRRCWCSM